MTLVKLDSGDYINTEAVDVIKGGDSPYIGLRSNNSFDITAADRDRIVEAMKPQQTQDMDIFSAGLPKVTVLFDDGKIPLRMTCNDLRYTISPEADA